MKRYIFSLALIATSMITGAHAQEVITIENIPTIERYANQAELLLEQKYGKDFQIKLQKLAKAIPMVEKHPKGALLAVALKMTESRIVRKNLEAYIRGKYSQKETFREDYLSLRTIDPLADIHPFYLLHLEKRIKDNPILREDSKDFRALIYLSLIHDEMKQSDPDWKMRVSNDWETAWKSIGHTEESILESERLRREKIAQTVAKLTGINPHSSVDLARMKDTIWSEKVSPNSYYFQAYTQMFSVHKRNEGRLRLDIPFEHTLQKYGLSCESNTATDLINYYRLQG